MRSSRRSWAKIRELFIAVLLLLGLLSPGCKEPEPGPPPDTGPRILDVLPPQAASGTLVTMQGERFGLPGPAATLSLAGLPLTGSDLHEWTNTSISFWLPAGASDGPLVVTTESGSSDGFPFVVTGASPTPEPRTSLPRAGALSGKHIVVSPGHGYYYPSASTGWTTQRGDTFGLVEDVHTNEIAMDYLIPMLERAGATVHACRERSRQTHEVVLDEGTGAPAYEETGSWFPTASSGLGYDGTDYRYATVAPQGQSTATWTPDIPLAGRYPVWVWYRADTNRATDATYVVHHTGGDTRVTVDQSVFSSRWVYLGTFHFNAGRSGRLTLTNQSSQAGKVVVADAARFGAGMGSIQEGGTASGQPRWLECAIYWTRYMGAPASVWNTADYNCRPRWANWMEDSWGPAVADAYLSLHTNAAATPNTGTGTSSFIAATNPSAGSASLQVAVHDQLVSDIRALWDAGWVDRGKKAHDYGEVYHTDDMPAVLVEIAFHDTETPDNDFLHLDRFRRDVARAFTKGLARHFDAAAVVPPLPPTRVLARDLSHGRIQISWAPHADALEPSAHPTGYVVYTSSNGAGFGNGRVAPAGRTSLVVDRVPPGQVLYFRVAATNEGGESLPSEVVGARASACNGSRVLVVCGFDRLDRRVRFYRGENTHDYAVPHLKSLDFAEDGAWGIDTATNEAVIHGDVDLLQYRVLDWILGEESTADETFSQEEQDAVSAYLSDGRCLLVTGAEVAWDLGHRGSPSDQAFLAGFLCAGYGADDSGGLYEASPPGGGDTLFAGSGTVSFDDGSHGVYDVDYPDVLVPQGAAVPCLLYGGDPAKVAGLQSVDPSGSRVVYLGFPLEAVWDDTVRNWMMAKVLAFFFA